jgi:hypothetical protein
MQPRTAATVEQLRESQWFARVGIHDAPSTAVFASSWQEAIDLCSAAEWENYQLEAANLFREALFRKSPLRYAEWNNHVLAVRPVAIEIAQERCAAVELDVPDRGRFLESVEWDMIHLLVEAEYADVLEPGFFCRLGWWYVNGHFPCGWRGPFSIEGRLVVY